MGTGVLCLPRSAVCRDPGAEPGCLPRSGVRSRPCRADELAEIDEGRAARLAARQARGSADPVVAAFAIQLPDTFDLVDLRGAAMGTGFEWAEEEVRRFGAELLFGVGPAPERKGFLGRLFGRG